MKKILLISSLGKVSENDYSSYQIEEDENTNKYKSFTSSIPFAINKAKKENIEKIRLVFLIPESIKNIEKIQNLIAENLSNDPQEKIEFFIHRTQFIGNFRQDNIIIFNQINNVINDIYAKILLHDEKYDEIVIDISRGHNVMIYSVLQAMNFYLIKHFIRYESLPELKIIISEEMSNQDGERIFKIEESQMNLNLDIVSALKEIENGLRNPIKTVGSLSKKEETIKLYKKINEEILPKNIRKIISEFGVLEKCIRYSLPLPIILAINWSELENFVKNNQNLPHEIIKKLERRPFKEVKSNRTEIIIRYYNLNNSIMYLDMMIEFIKKFNEMRKEITVNKSGMVDLKKLKKSRMVEFIKKLNGKIAETVLNNEISKIEYQPKEFIEKMKDVRERDSNISRNLIAHAGFSYTFLKVELDPDGNILVGYKKERIEELRNIIRRL